MDCPNRRCDTEAAPGLPDDPPVEILSRVPGSLCRFKCVSKAWRDLIADPLHRKKLPQALEGFFFMVKEQHCSSLFGTSLFSSDWDCGNGDYKYCTDVSAGEELPCCGFVDVLQRSVRLVDFSYLSELPGIKDARLIHCCNGLLLFAVECNWGASLSYVVCNPATKQCVAVPRSGLTWHQMISGSTITSLLFDPGICWHFNLVQVFVEGYKTTVHVYSSETHTWIHSKSDWGCYHIALYSPGVYVNGMLHLLSYWGKDQLTVADVEGNIQKIIPAPCQVGRKIGPLSGYIGQSQGCLYYICREPQVICDGFSRTIQVWQRLLIWVFQDYDKQQWVLKDSVSFSKLFGEWNCHMHSNYNVVGIHPDDSLVFLVQHWDRKLISYHMDSKEVRDLCTLGHGYKRITPYVPYFSEFGA